MVRSAIISIVVCSDEEHLLRRYCLEKYINRTLPQPLAPFGAPTCIRKYINLLQNILIITRSFVGY